jgi:hypothetical protein
MNYSPSLQNIPSGNQLQLNLEISPNTKVQNDQNPIASDNTKSYNYLKGKN